MMCEHAPRRALFRRAAAALARMSGASSEDGRNASPTRERLGISPRLASLGE